ncbi:MAG: PEP-CTERM sorting domain-containing protein [Rhizobiales bacterium]|nr:PEP-CTERM sorting domain-containing protein [Hyphomicrobiales bacterium]
MKLKFALIAAVALSVSSVAHADSVTGTLSATYYQVVEGSPDFPGGTPIVPNGSGLVNGLPFVTGGVSSIGPSGELQWWTTANPNVSVTGTGVITLPYGSNMYAPNSTGSNDSRVFETAKFLGSFSLASAGTVNFAVNSDDDTFVYLNGILIGQNPGIHGVTSVSFAGNGLAGLNTLEIFYADREQTGAYLSVTADVQLTAVGGVPEPSTWAMMILGFAGVGFMAYRRRHQTATLAA